MIPYLVRMNDRGYPGMGFDWEHAQAHAGHPFLHVVFLVLFVALLIVAVYAAWRWLANRSPRTAYLAPSPAGGAPADLLGIVRMRYARGEIGRDEFLRTSADLGGAPAAAFGPPAAEPAGAQPSPSTVEPAAAEPEVVEPPAAEPPADDAPTAT